MYMIHFHRIGYVPFVFNISKKAVAAVPIIITQDLIHLQDVAV